MLPELSFHVCGGDTKPYIGMCNSEHGKASSSTKGGGIHTVKPQGQLAKSLMFETGGPWPLGD